MLLAVTHQLSGIKEKKKSIGKVTVGKVTGRVGDREKELQYFLIFGHNSKYLEDPGLLIAEIEHSVKEYQHNPRQGIFLLELASQVGIRLVEDLIELQSLPSKPAFKKLAEIRELSAACCNVLNHITIASDNAAIYSRTLIWAPDEAMDSVRLLKSRIFSLFGCLSKFSDNPARIDWHAFSEIVSSLANCYEVVRKETEKQKARMKFYHGIKNSR